MSTWTKNRRTVKAWNSSINAFCVSFRNVPPLFICSLDFCQKLTVSLKFSSLRANIISYPDLTVTEMYVTTDWPRKGWARDFLSADLCPREDLRRYRYERYAGGLAPLADFQLTTLYRTIENWLPLNCQWGRIIRVLRRLMGEPDKFYRDTPNPPPPFFPLPSPIKNYRSVIKQLMFLSFKLHVLS